jgi:hypothetical protein
MINEKEFDIVACLVFEAVGILRNNGRDWPEDPLEAFFLASKRLGEIHKSSCLYKEGKATYADMVAQYIRLVAYLCRFLEDFSIWAVRKNIAGASKILHYEDIIVSVKKEIEFGVQSPVYLLSLELCKVYKALLHLGEGEGFVDHIIGPTIASIAIVCKHLFTFDGVLEERGDRHISAAPCQCKSCRSTDMGNKNIITQCEGLPECGEDW